MFHVLNAFHIWDIYAICCSIFKQFLLRIVLYVIKIKNVQFVYFYLDHVDRSKTRK